MLIPFVKTMNVKQDNSIILTLNKKSLKILTDWVEGLFFKDTENQINESTSWLQTISCQI